jgi:hypothetical protein
LADSRLLRDLRAELRAANMAAVPMDMVADKIYNIIAARGIASLRQNPTPHERLEDRAGASVRVPVEWSFGKIALHFPFINYYFNMKINEREVGEYMNVAALLTNIHTCLYGSSCASYFSQTGFVVKPPEIEAYMAF